MIYIYTDTRLKYAVETFNFPAGEVQVRLPDTLPAICAGKIGIRANIHSSDDVMALLLTVDALKRRYPNFNRVEKVLCIPYLPYSRQDRVCAGGEALSVSVIAGLINSLGFDKVITLDCHSDVGAALITNCVNIPQADIVHQWVNFEFTPSTAIIAPDAGAYKKAAKVRDSINPGCVLLMARKERDPVSGFIKLDFLETEVPAKCIIIDDICDGGATFILLAEALRQRGAKTITLYVTHGICSKGYGVFDGLIDRLYQTDSFPLQTNDTKMDAIWCPAGRAIMEDEF